MPDTSETAGLEAQIEALIRKASDRLRQQLDDARPERRKQARSAPRVERGIIADGLISSACSVRIERALQARAAPRPAALAVNSFDP
jgi:hypothetical protein